MAEETISKIGDKGLMISRVMDEVISKEQLLAQKAALEAQLVKVNSYLAEFKK